MTLSLTYQEIKTYIESPKGNGCCLLTTEEDFEQLKEKGNKSVSNMKFNIKCKCGNEFYKTYSNFKQNYKQCPKCSKIQAVKKVSTPHQEVKEYIESKETGNGCKLITTKESYKNVRSCIIIKCKCGNNFETTFTTFKHNHKQCPKCGYKITGKKLKLNYNYVKNYINDKSTGNNCILISEEKEYKGVTKKILIKCSCGKNFYTTFNNFRNKNKKQCDECTSKILNKKYSKTNEDFKKEFYKLVNNEYTLLSKYINCKTKITIRHNCDFCNNYEYAVRPNDFLRGKRCPKCYGNIKKTQEQFEQEIYDLVGDEYSVLGKYKNTETKILIRHNSITCNNFEYKVKPANFLVGNRCPMCNESRGEQNIRYFLQNNNINFIPQYEFDGLIGLGGGNLRFDFAIFEDKTKIKLKCLVEYDGEFHYKTIKSYKNESVKKAKDRLELQQHYDKLKDDYCKDNNIKLLRIPYWKFDNIEDILGKELYDCINISDSYNKLNENQTKVKEIKLHSRVEKKYNH